MLKKISLRMKAGASLETPNKAGFNPAELALSLGNQGLSRYLKMYRKVPRRARDVPLQRVSCLLACRRCAACWSVIPGVLFWLFSLGWSDRTFESVENIVSPSALAIVRYFTRVFECIPLPSPSLHERRKLTKLRCSFPVCIVETDTVGHDGRTDNRIDVFLAMCTSAKFS